MRLTLVVALAMVSIPAEAQSKKSRGAILCPLISDAKLAAILIKSGRNDELGKLECWGVRANEELIVIETIGEFSLVAQPAQSMHKGWTHNDWLKP
jgi:hypothetical protein